MGSNLSVGIFFIHNKGTPSDTFSKSPTFEASKNFSESEALPPTHDIANSAVYCSAGLASSATLEGTPAFTGSSILSLSSVFSASRAIGDSSIARSPAFDWSVVNLSAAGGPSLLADSGRRIQTATIGHSWPVVSSGLFAASAQNASRVAASGCLVDSVVTVATALVSSAFFIPSLFAEWSRFAGESHDMNSSHSFAKTGAARPNSPAFAVSSAPRSAEFAPSGPIQWAPGRTPSASSPFAGSNVYVGSRSFCESRLSEGGSALVASGVFTGSRTPTGSRRFTFTAPAVETATFLVLPAPTDLPAGLSYTTSVTASMTLTLSTVIQTSTVMLVTTLVSSLTELFVVTDVWNSELMSRTLTLTVSLVDSLTETWLATFVDIPVYHSSAVASAVNIIFHTTAEGAQSHRLSDAVIIGAVTGAAVVLALLIGGIIFLVQRGKAATVTSESSLDGTMVQSDFAKAAFPDLGNDQGYEDGEAQGDARRFELHGLETLGAELGDDNVADEPVDGSVWDQDVYI
jgi:hypothetical protein